MKRIAGIALMTLAAGAALGFTAAPASAGGHDGYHGYHGHHGMKPASPLHGYSGHGDWDRWGGEDDGGHGYY
ncbi:hypothetical protein [Nocardiopsis lambiniae]|uniref:Sulfur globule protein n=1 Tax=Nocardiopsis lambiniae TaxID=3075539 RepID=A0ABU2MDF9_9ACTN|nr:hypothetical protein [Nocardiopsis sp. DSM 44743]MDT0330721.1 hypothetical protein [Nocardiopsis sp. DSM 44743]